MASKADIMDIFHCPLCIEKYNLTERRPKILDCGHTNCLECLSKYVKKAGRTCPQCRQPFAEAPFFIKDNFLICPYLEEGPSSSASSGASTPTSAVSQRFYCKRCERDATDNCLLQNHDVDDKTSVVLQRAQEAKLQAKNQFAREAAMLKDLTDTLDGVRAAVTNKGGLTARLNREVDAAKAQKGVLDKTTELVENVPGTAFQDNEDIPRALDHFLQENSTRLFLLEEKKRMMDMAKKCSVMVTSDDSGATWHGKLSLDERSPPEERVLFYLLYLQLVNQQSTAGPSRDGDAYAPSAPPVGGEEKGDNWTSRPEEEVSLENLIANVKKCVLEGNIPDEKNVDNDSDEDDDSDESVSIVSDAGTIPEVCKVSKKVFVGRIPPTATPQDIKDLFSKFGTINYVRFLVKNKLKKGKAAPAPTQPPKHTCALVYVPDEFTVENILRNRPIVYRNKGCLKGFLLNVQEDKSQKKEDKAEAKRQRRQRRPRQGAGPSRSQQETSNGSQNDDDSDAPKRVFVNQVPIDVTEKQLQDRFSTYGSVTNVSKRRHGVGHKCMAFITFKDEKSVERVLSSRPVNYFGPGYTNGIDLQVREFRGGRPPPAAPGYNNLTDSMAAVAAATAASAAHLVTLQIQQNAAMRSMQSQSGGDSPSKPSKQAPQRPPLPPKTVVPGAQQLNQKQMPQQQNQKLTPQQQNQKLTPQQQNQRQMPQQLNHRQMAQQLNQPQSQNQNKPKGKSSKNGDDNQCSIM